MIQVYHDDVLVAEVMTEELETAYHMTQNIYGSWSKSRLVFGENDQLVVNRDYHPEVQVKAPLHVHNGRQYGLRSTMVGDILVKEGAKYKVAFFGFEKV